MNLIERLRTHTMCPTPEEAADEIERLTAELKTACDIDQELKIALQLAEAELVEVKVERDALAADAARYRWLRECNHALIMHGDSYNCELMMEEQLNAAIDAAIQGEQPRAFQ